MKDNKEKKSFFAVLGNYFKSIWLSFIDSFKYNPSKLACLFLFVPGILLGFCLKFHFDASKLFATYNETIVEKMAEAGIVHKVQTLHSAFQMFALIVLGAVMMFVAVNVKGKRNLGSTIQAALVTSAIVIFGIFWIMNFYRTNTIYNVDKWTSLSDGSSYSVTSKTNLISQICVIVSMICSVIGTVLSFIFRDKTYKKDVF